MGTRSVIRVHTLDKKSIVLVALYQQFDGYFDSVGEELRQFLDGFMIVNGIPPDNTFEKCANGMGCLAAQIVKHFKSTIGGAYIVPADQEEEFNYDVYIKNGKLCLDGEGHDEKKKFKIKSEVHPYYKISITKNNPRA